MFTGLAGLQEPGNQVLLTAFAMIRNRVIWWEFSNSLGLRLMLMKPMSSTSWEQFQNLAKNLEKLKPPRQATKRIIQIATRTNVVTISDRADLNNPIKSRATETATDNAFRTNDVTGIVPGTIRTNRRWWTLGDLNPRPSGCKPDALPTELSAPYSRPCGHFLLSVSF